MCVKDDRYIFAAGGKLETNQGVLQCRGELPYTYQYKWELKDNETTLALKRYGWVDCQIVKLTQDSLVLKAMDPAVGMW